MLSFHNHSLTFHVNISYYNFPTINARLTGLLSLGLSLLPSINKGTMLAIHQSSGASPVTNIVTMRLHHFFHKLCTEYNYYLRGSGCIYDFKKSDICGIQLISVQGTPYFTKNWIKNSELWEEARASADFAWSQRQRANSTSSVQKISVKPRLLVQWSSRATLCAALPLLFKLPVTLKRS